ncbi:RHH-type proline utilization regulon transcriptional repressor/proline dehydrogenase/delta 1-pyrroline-5-carboxylate dehydrogenase [Mumia flava]|uniref:L-glutamate gamma-semialdehyde dehydrogenase n=1 Tax=Mumia flava TaxID=1348852 RepID=A0A2M9B7F6_9ACTN|nr:RHH-type proline utilization regulon transcriptional repressor/proline dehydrogenase/delta 1-pyrroline-5-carboxylate dehydrogenase [Mumia flava]
MNHPAPSAVPHPGDDPRDLADDAVALVRRWLDASARIPTDKAAARLADVLEDPDGLAFTTGFVDGVIRPEDPSVAARTFRDLSRRSPRFLPWHLRTGVRVGGTVAPALPRAVIPVVRRALREMVGHLLVDASDRRLGKAIAHLRSDDVRLNINLLGEAVLGEREAARRLSGTRRLLARADVDYVSIKVSSTVAPHSPWAFDEAVEDVVDHLGPLFRQAAQAPTRKFINLDMEEYRDLDLTIAVFTRLLDQPDLMDLEAGIVLQAYLPDSLAAMIRLQEWAADRRSRGGAGIKVRVVKGANLPMEQVEAALHDWPLATWESKQATDTHYKRVLDYALRPEHVANVRIGVAGHNLFDLAWTWLLAGRRGVREQMDVEMLLGMAQSQAEVVRAEVGSLLLYTPVVHPGEFDVAIAYLVRRLEEGASQANFMSAVFDLHDDAGLFEREEQRFRRALDALDDHVPAPKRTQDRAAEAAAGIRTPSGTPFHNTPDTDPALPANRTWARAILDRVETSDLGRDLVDAHTVRTGEELESVVSGAVAAADGWAALGGAGRAEILERVADELEQRRGELLEVMASEAGKTIDQGDPEVSEAADFARWYAALARELDDVDGAEHVPARLTVVTPPWNFPIAIPTGSTLAALAAGSSVVVKPAPQSARCGSVMVETLWRAGVPKDVLRLAHVDEGDLGRTLIADPRVDRVILTGAYATAELFRSFRQDLPLLAETSGKNAIVVTPSADLDLAAKDVAASAFGHAGQKCSAASLVILVGSVARSRRFRDQLVDAVTSLTVGPPSDPTSQVGPLIEPASGKLLDALTTLAPGESWLVEPQRLDDEGRLWTPGVRTGVRRGSRVHLTEFFGPVLGVMTAETLDEAIDIQNQVDFGLTAGLHSLDSDEIGLWLDRVEAGNLYVNRGITGAIVRRQPFGGWKRSAVGAGTKAGGPDYLIGLGDWRSRPAAATAQPDAAAATLLLAARAAGLGEDDLARLERSARSDAAAWSERFATGTDPSQVGVERNVLRHLPTPVAVRLADGAAVGDLVRVAAAAAVVGSAHGGSQVSVSAPQALPDAIAVALGDLGIAVRVEGASAWLDRAAAFRGTRIRLIGGDPVALAEALDGRPDVAIYAHAVTESGRIELLPFLHEQAVSVTAHRFGIPSHLTDALL